MLYDAATFLITADGGAVGNGLLGGVRGPPLELLFPIESKQGAGRSLDRRARRYRRVLYSMRFGTVGARRWRFAALPLFRLHGGRHAVLAMC